MLGTRPGKVWLWGVGRTDAAMSGFHIAEAGGDPQAGDAVVALGGKRLPGQYLDSGLYIVNRGAAAFLTMNRAALQRKLERAGVAVNHSASGAVGSRSSWVNRRRLIVRLFELAPLQVAVIGGLKPAVGGRANEQLDSSDLNYRRAVKIAVRALYAAGLDCGCVEVELGERGNSRAGPIYLPDRELGGGAGEEAAMIWLTALQRFAGDYRCSLSSERPILLGADPEFLLASKTGKVVPASRFLQDGHGAGCDGVFIGGQVRYPVAELRPAPAETPEQLIKNIRRLLLQAAEKIDDPTLRWLAGGMPVSGFALGGHIHISGVPFHGRLLRLLDSYVAFPLALAEPESARRRRPRYGSLGDFRLQPYGGFEYRTPSSWLVSPLAAKAALSLALLCACECAALSYCPAEEERYAAAYYANDRERLMECMEPLLAEMRATASWRRLAGGIEPFFKALARGACWDEASDFRAKWRISGSDSDVCAAAHR
ncbi:hypothetical protein [Paenibacillus sp. GCM10027626]|uniref:putative amidoligase domain-containing protein n=1 Tax=Paenibacillus sp. GCM10027626 TaxID=3273411 RepID=UPI003626CF5B